MRRVKQSVKKSLNSEDTDPKSHFATSDLGLLCLLMSYKKDARLIWVKANVCLTVPYWFGGL